MPRQARAFEGDRLQPAAEAIEEKDARTDGYGAGLDDADVKVGRTKADQKIKRG